MEMEYHQRKIIRNIGSYMNRWLDRKFLNSSRFKKDLFILCRILVMDLMWIESQNFKTLWICTWLLFSTMWKTSLICDKLWIIKKYCKLIEQNTNKMLIFWFNEIITHIPFLWFWLDCLFNELILQHTNLTLDQHQF